MTRDDLDEKLRNRLRLQSMRMKKAEKERDTLLSQTVYIGTLGLLFILPVVVGVYTGLWLDKMSTVYSSRWTLSLLIVGMVTGIVNVYLYIRKQS